jgi:hypothetical protein
LDVTSMWRNEKKRPCESVALWGSSWNQHEEGVEVLFTPDAVSALRVWVRSFKTVGRGRLDPP